MGHIYLDVFPWINATSANKTGIVMNGLFRHADRLSRHPDIIPAYIGHKGQIGTETEFCSAAHLIEQRIGDTIYYLTEDAHCLRDSGNIWLSLGIDQQNPDIASPQFQIKKAAILHDTLSAEGYFGDAQKLAYKNGQEYLNFLLYVSETSFTSFLALNKVKSQMMGGARYGNWHNSSFLGDLVRPTKKARLVRGVTVGSLFRRKNVPLSIQLNKNLGLRSHVHLGRNGDYHAPELMELFGADVFWADSPTDATINKMLGSSTHFFCLSSAEGFSITPLEAMMADVPYILISDIPVHKEIYGGFESINFISVSPSGGMCEEPKSLKRLSQEDRQIAYERFKPHNVIEPAIRALMSL